MGRILDKVKYEIKERPVIQDYFIGTDSENNGKTVNFEMAAVISTVAGQGQADRIISGRPVWIPDTLSFFIPTITYYLQGELLYTEPITITLDEGDTFDPRIDVIAVTIDQEVYVQKGTPAPDPAKPTLPDGNDYLELTFVEIAAGGLVPNGALSEQIYDEFVGEPNEWTVTESTANTRIKLGNETNPFKNNKCIYIVSPNSGDLISFFNDAPITVNLEDSITLAVRLDTRILFRPRMFMSFLLNGSVVSDTINIINNSYNFNTGFLYEYQLISIPLSAFTFSNIEFDRINIQLFNLAGSVIRIDDVTRVIGINQPPENEVYVLPTATDTVLGGVKIGSGINITNDGVISAQAYTLPIATDTILGGVKVDGTTITVAGDGTISGTASVTNTSDLTNDGADGINPFITAADVNLSGYVPYTGATQDVDLNTKNLTVGQINGANFGERNIASLYAGALAGVGAGNYSVSVGSSASRSASGDYKIDIGYNTGRNSTGSRNVSVGSSANQYGTGDSNVLIGDVAAGNPFNQTGSFNVGIGADSSRFSKNISNSVGVGYQSLYGAHASKTVVVGSNQKGYFTREYNTRIGHTDTDFFEDPTTQFVINSADVDFNNNRLTIISHGFAIGVEFFFKYKSFTVGGIGNLAFVPYLVVPIDANTIEFVGRNLTSAGTGDHTFAANYNVSNSTAIGANSFTVIDNQVMLGDANITSVRTANPSYVPTDDKDFVTKDYVDNKPSIPIENINQVAHGFIVGDGIKNNGTIYVKALADSPTNSDIIGIVSEVTDVDNFTVQYGGIMTTGTWTLGEKYFLSNVTAGLVTNSTLTYTTGEVRQFVGTGVPTGLLIEIDLGDEVVEADPTAVSENLFDAQSLLLSIADNSPFAQVVPNSSFVGRKATGDIGVLTVAEANAMLLPKIDAVEEDTTVTGTKSIDWNLYETFKYVITGAVVFSDINLPAAGKSKTITLHISGNFAITYPTGWDTYISGAYDGTVLNCVVVEYVNSSTPFYKVQITQPD